MFFRNELYTPCGAGLNGLKRLILASIFQSTRPVRGGTVDLPLPTDEIGKFQSTRPVRGGTGARLKIG